MKIHTSSRITLSAAMLSAISFCADAELSTGFQAGLPKSCTVEVLDGGGVRKSSYRNIDDAAGWQSGRFGAKGAVAICPSRTLGGEAASRRISFCDIEVKGENAYVKWVARSAHPDFPDSYKVMYRVSGEENWTTIYENEGENSRWIDRIVKLPLGEGSKQVDVAFECTSAKGYMLLLDDLVIGSVADEMVALRRVSPFFVSPDEKGETTVEVSVLNTGVALDPAEVYLKKGDLTVSAAGSISPLNPCDERVFTFDCPVVPNESYTFDVCMKTVSGKELVLGTIDIQSSYYPRTILIDKASGTWCSNCPEGELVLEEFEETYGEQLLPLSTHTGDIMVQPAYFTALGFSSVPSFVINRNPDTRSESISMVKSAMKQEILKETFAKIESKAYLDGETITLEHSAEFARMLDNASDRYRIAYTVLRDCYGETAEYKQINGMNNSTYERFYYLTDYVDAPLMVYKNVTSDCETAFTGIAGSLPASIDSYTPCDYRHSFKMPARCKEPERVSIATYLLDTETGEVLNSCHVKTLSESGIHDATTVGESFDAKVVDGTLQISMPETATWKVGIYAADGTLRDLREGTAPHAIFSLPEGLSIISITSGSTHKTLKVVN